MADGGGLEDEAEPFSLTDCSEQTNKFDVNSEKFNLL